MFIYVHYVCISTDRYKPGFTWKHLELGIEIKKFLTRHLPDTYAGAHKIAVT